MKQTGIHGRHLQPGQQTMRHATLPLIQFNKDELRGSCSPHSAHQIRKRRPTTPRNHRLLNKYGP